MLSLLLSASLLSSVADLPDSIRRIQPNGRFFVTMNEEITVELDDHYRAKVVSVRSVDNASAVSMPPLRKDGRIRFTLFEAADHSHLLKVENGLPGNFDYGALVGMRIGPGIGMKTTSTCTVRGGLYSVERWEEPMGLVLIGPFKAHDAGDVACAVNADLPDSGADPDPAGDSLDKVPPASTRS